MNRSTRDLSILDLVGDPGDEALRAALRDLASLAEVPAPAPSDALAAVFETRPGPQRTRPSTGRIAGGTTAFVGLLVASGTAAAALGGAIPWIDHEPAAPPPAGVVRPSQPGHPVTPDAYAGGTPHTHPSPRTTGDTSDEEATAAQQPSRRTTVAPTDLPRAFDAARRPRLTVTPRTSSPGDRTDAAVPADDDPHEPDDANEPQDPNEPQDLPEPKDDAQVGQDAQETATLKPTDRAPGQGKPVKLAKSPTAAKPDATTPATSLRSGPGKDGEPTDPSTLATDPAATTEDPGPVTDEDPRAVTDEDPGPVAEEDAAQP